MTHGPIRQEYAYDLDKNLTALKVRSGDVVLADNFYQDGVSMCIMQIGELTKKLSPEFRVATEREFHWKAIADMRDRYAHGYLEMNAKIIWVTASQDLPVLRKQCADLLEQARALQSEESKEE